MIHDGGGIKERKVWHIQKNVHAQRETKMHEVVWTWTGKSSDFVKCLRAGDRISVVARALVGLIPLLALSWVLITFTTVPRMGESRREDAGGGLLCCLIVFRRAII